MACARAEQSKGSKDWSGTQGGTVVVVPQYIMYSTRIWEGGGRRRRKKAGSQYSCTQILLVSVRTVAVENRVRKWAPSETAKKKRGKNPCKGERTEQSLRLVQVGKKVRLKESEGSNSSGQTERMNRGEKGEMRCTVCAIPIEL